MRISDWSSDVCSSDLDDDAVVVHHDRRLGKAQSVGDQFKLGHILSLACPHLLCFAAIMPVRTLFATNFYEADIGTPDLLAELEESSRLFAEEDGAGRRWSRDHGCKGYTSYESHGDLPRPKERRVGKECD